MIEFLISDTFINSFNNNNNNNNNQLQNMTNQPPRLEPWHDRRPVITRVFHRSMIS